MDSIVNADVITERLKKGNAEYVMTGKCDGRFCESVRRDTADNGQKPFAIVITCSDSRVIPEAIFSCGIGELFVIRVAGNVIGDAERGSVEYAVGHLKVKYALMLGHTRCGAVNGAIGGHFEGFSGYLTKDIAKAIGCEKDERAASGINARYQAEKLKKDFPELFVSCALYDIESGKVEFFR